MSKTLNRTVAGVLALAGATILTLANPAAAEGTAAQRMACTADAMSLCSADIPNVGRITACLRRERARVSTACQQVMGLRSGKTEMASASSARQ